MHQHSLFSFGISYKLVSHSVIGLVTSEPGYSSEEPAPWLTLFPFHAAWLREALVSAGVTILPSEDRPPVQLLHRPLFYQMASEQSQSPGEPRAQQSAEDLLTPPWRWFRTFVWGKKRGELDSKPCIFLVARGVGNRQEVTEECVSDRRSNLTLRTHGFSPL